MTHSEDDVVPGFTVPASIQTLRASDGYALRYRLWEARAPRATLVLLNGIMSNSSWFSPLVPALREADLQLVGADRRGSGLNEAGWGDAPSAGQLVDDAVAIARAHHDANRPLFVVGWCWGAALAVAVTAKLRPEVAGLVLVTPGMFTTSSLRANLQAQRERFDAAHPEEAVIDSPIDEAWFTAGPALDGFIRKDPHRVRQITPRLVDISGKLATAAVARLRKLEAPTLVLLATDDQATDNDATRKALGTVDPAHLEMQELPTRHGMQFDAPAQVADAIVVFARRHGAKAA